MSIDMDALTNLLHRGWTIDELSGYPGEYDCVVIRPRLDPREPDDVEVGDPMFGETVDAVYDDANSIHEFGSWHVYVCRDNPVFAINRAIELAEELDQKTGNII